MDPETFAEAARATIAKMMTEGSFVSYTSGTVRAVEVPMAGSPLIAEVALDSPEGSSAPTIPCPVIVPVVPDENQRVLVAYSPPHAHYVVGVLQWGEEEHSTCPSGSANLVDNQDGFSDYTPASFSPYSTEGDVAWNALLNGWTIPVSGVWSASATATVEGGAYLDLFRVPLAALQNAAAVSPADIATIITGSEAEILARQPVDADNDWVNVANVSFPASVGDLIVATPSGGIGSSDNVNGYRFDLGYVCDGGTPGDTGKPPS